MESPEWGQEATRWRPSPRSLSPIAFSRPSQALSAAPRRLAAELAGGAAELSEGRSLGAWETGFTVAPRAGE